MTKTNKEKVIKKVRKEIKLPKNFGKLEQELNDLKADTQHYKLTEKERKEYFSAGFKSGKEYGLKTVTPINNTTEIKEEKNHAITLVIVWLAILTVLAIYVSIK
jgi:hypothetical protein